MKWLKMRNVLSDMVDREVALLLTTELPNNYRSTVEFDAKNVTNPVVIMLNAKYAKAWDDIIDSVVHEITHVKNGDSGHVELHNNWSKQISDTKIDFLRRMGDVEDD